MTLRGSRWRNESEPSSEADLKQADGEAQLKLWLILETWFRCPTLGL